MVCLKHVGITDSDRQKLEMSVNTLASWSAHACSTRPGNPSGPEARMLTCLKVLLTSAAESMITQSGTTDALMQCYLP